MCFDISSSIFEYKLINACKSHVHFLLITFVFIGGFWAEGKMAGGPTIA